MVFTDIVVLLPFIQKRLKINVIIFKHPFGNIFILVFVLGRSPVLFSRFYISRIDSKSPVCVGFCNIHFLMSVQEKL